ncbi:MAG: FKBP-type peptidyl-prolyl cis-trans isomerase [Bacteroidales bacterium]|jgi:FKBP-type peptidyl-prolyl cis-trans isomerase|nr:FKBP-type peptidyl-prolyl cis-trans isomerase [Bacteroidales bacterium]
MVYNRLLVWVFILIFTLIFFSCNNNKKETKKNNQKPKYTEESMEKINQMLVEKDVEVIRNYIERRGWEMQMTEAGLWYMIYKEGSGELIQKNDYITINYKVWLMDGTLCYSSDSLGAKSFIVGKGGVETGLEQGVLLLKKGSRARFIMPPHLAHGLIGDNKKIPARATIIYDVEVLEVKNNIQQ